jgi:chromosomal replication initiation ATPase DnaA
VRQLALQFPALERNVATVHVEAECQAGARRALAAWREWPGGLMALIGPEGAGKSHLAALWALETGARPATASEAEPQGGPRLLEDADEVGIGERGLLSLIESARLGEGALLLTARTPPAAWPVTLPDLASRLPLIPTAQIADPTDADLGSVFVKHLGDRGAEASEALVGYVIRRIERSFAAAGAIAAVLDQAALERKQRITRKLAADVLGEAFAGSVEEPDER